MLSAALIFSLNYNYHFGIYDEGFLITGAEEVLKGKVIYRDFIKEYPPLNFWAIAGIFKLFGHNYLYVRIYFLVLRVATVVLIYHASKRVIRNNMAVLPAIIFMLVPGPWHKSVVAFLVWLVLYGLFICIEKPGKSKTVLLALVTILSLLYRQDVGLIALVGSVSVILVSKLYLHGRQGAAKAIDVLSLYLVSSTLFMLPVLYYFGANSALKPFWDNVFVKAWMIREQTSFMPLPGINSMNAPMGQWAAFCYLPVVFYVILLVYAAFDDVSSKERGYAAVLGFVGLASYVNFIKMPDLSHLLQYQTPSYLASIYMGYVALEKIKKYPDGVALRGKIVRVTLVIVFCACVAVPVGFVFLLDSTPLGAMAYSQTLRVRTENFERLNNKRLPLYLPEEQRMELEEIVDFINSEYRPTDKVAVIPTSFPLGFLSGHDALFASDFFFTPEMFSDEQKAHELDRFKCSRVKFLIMDRDFAVKPQSFFTAFFFDNYRRMFPEMYDYIVEEYSPYKVIGRYYIFMLKR